MTLVEQLGLEVPLIQAPMAGSQLGRLAVEVCKSGGLGSLPAAMLDADTLREELAAVASSTARPVNVNFFCHAPSAVDHDREHRWRERLRKYYAELDLDPAAVPDAPARRPFDEEGLAVVEELRPAVVSFHFGLPAEVLLDRVRATGALVLSSATAVAEARWLEARGVDAVIAQGVEAGGHRGMFLCGDVASQFPLARLLPAVLTAIDVPVVAAGGVGDAQHVARLIREGAAAVQVGTAYLRCPEATTTPVHRAALASAGEGSTQLTNLFTGRLARGVVNRLMRELGPVSDDVPGFPLAAAAIAPLRAAAEKLGSGDFSPLWSGTNPASAREESAAAVTARLTELL